jgi:hypothetical protein
MRRLTLLFVPLLALACERQLAAPSTPDLSADRRANIQSFQDNVVGFRLGTCSGFDILVDWTAELRQVSVTDAAGSLDRAEWIYHILGQSKYYNSLDPSLAVYGGPGEMETDHFDYDGHSLLRAGPIWRIVLPGTGPILMDVGEVSLDLSTGVITHSGGLHLSQPGDFAALCDALTP